MDFQQIADAETFLFPLLPYVVIATSFLVVFGLTFINSPYGRHAGKTYHLVMNAKVAWFLQESTSFLCIPIFLIYGNDARSNPVNIILLGFFILHYIQRALIFPFLMKKSATMPVMTFVLATIWCIYNAYVQGRYFGYYSNYPKDWLSSTQFLIGVVIFFIGMAINLHSDQVLRSLRSKNETGYKIPQRGFFKYVSCANFFGEIVEWFGFFVMTQSPHAFAFFIFAIGNLGPRAIQHHRWYQQKFEDYPKERKAIVPFLL